MAKARRAANTNRAKSQHRSGHRPTWEGHLRLSLVTCPVALYTATESAAEVHFNLINPKTHNRIRMQTVDAGTGEPVDRAELVKGFAVAKNKYILFEPGELDAVKLESTRNIDIEEFVDAAGIDRIYWDQPYYLAPAGKTGVEAFAMIQAAMAKQKKIALGRLVLHQRERICALEPRDGGILLTTLRSRDEIRSTAGIFGIHLPKPDARMLDIAEKIIDQQAAKFDPSGFKDPLRGRPARADRAQEEGRAGGVGRARGEGGEGRRPHGRAAQEPQGRRRLAREGPALPGGAREEEGQAQARASQARRLTILAAGRFPLK